MKMNTNDMDKELQLIAEKINQLAGLDYHKEEYDQLEEEVHKLEDDLMNNYGKYLEEVFRDVHQKYCPDNEVLLPIAYLAHQYIKTESGYDVPPEEGVPVKARDYPDKETRLVLVPKPARILLQVDKDSRLEVWRSN